MAAQQFAEHLRLPPLGHALENLVLVLRPVGGGKDFRLIGSLVVPKLEGGDRLHLRHHHNSGIAEIPQRFKQRVGLVQVPHHPGIFRLNVDRIVFQRFRCPFRSFYVVRRLKPSLSGL